MAHKKFNKNKPAKRRGRRQRPSSRGTVSRKDSFGNTYGGKISSLALNKAQNFPPKPRTPIGNADYSTCQAIQTVAIGAGFNDGTAIAPPYVAAAAGANTYFSFGFSLQDLAQQSTLTQLFDQYRLDKVCVKFVPQSTSINVTNVASPNNSVSSLYAVLDFDDATAPTSLAAVTEYDNVQMVTAGQGLDIEITPSYTPGVFAQSAFTGYAVQKAGWVDCNNPAVAHYGLKGVVTGLQALSTLAVNWDIFIKYYVSFRNTR